MRGWGLLLAAELTPGLDAPAVARACLDAGTDRQRGHADGAAVRAAAARHRRRDRRGGRAPRRRTRAASQEAKRHEHPSAPRGGRPRPDAPDDDPRSRRGVEGRARRRCRSHWRGLGAALLFEKPSARTRVSTEMAVTTLGGHPVYIRGEEVGIGTRESVEDVARTLAGYCAVIAAACLRPRDAGGLRGRVGGARS